MTIGKQHFISKSYPFTFFLFCMSLLSVPINIEFLNILRIPDILFILVVTTFAASNPKIKTSQGLIYSAYFGILLFSSLTSMVHNNSIRFSGVAFYYKYSLLFIIPLIVSEVVKNRRRLTRVVKILYYVYIVLVIWVYVYNLLRINSLIVGNPRVSFPFSYYNVSDAHLYSSYLVFTFVAYLEYLRKFLNHRVLHSTFIFVVSVYALFLTGSKSGILILLIYSTIITIRFAKSFRFAKSLGIIKMSNLLKISVVLIFIGTIITLGNDYHKEVLPFYERATTINIDDASIRSRYLYFFKALEEIMPNLLLIGNGPTGSSQMWYDGGISILLAHGGLLGLFLITIYILFLILKLRGMVNTVASSDLYKVFTLLLFIYILLSIITEHYLITRNLLPVATLLSVIFANIKQNYIESSMNANHLVPLK